MERGEERRRQVELFVSMIITTLRGWHFGSGQVEMAKVGLVKADSGYRRCLQLIYGL